MSGSDQGDDLEDDFLGRLRLRVASRPRTLVFPEGTEPRVHAAVARCLQEELFRPVLMGSPDEVRRGLVSVGVDAEQVEIVDPHDSELRARTMLAIAERRSEKGDSASRFASMSEDPLMQAGVMVGSGEVDGAVAGCVRTTADVVRAGLTCVGLAEGIRTLSSAFYMVFDSGHRAGPGVLTFTDAGVVPVPTADQLADIGAAAARSRSRVVGDEPRVAFLSYSTKGSAEGPAVTVVREALERFRVIMPEVPSDGELQGDAALIPEVARVKAEGSPVAGRANVLVFPDLGAANLAYKLVQHLGGALALGPIVQGLSRPFNDLSRGATATDIAWVACITALMAD